MKRPINFFVKKILTLFLLIFCIFSFGIFCSCKSTKLVDYVTTYISNQYSGESENISVLASYGYETLTTYDNTKGTKQSIKKYSLCFTLKDILITEISYHVVLKVDGKEYKGAFSLSPTKNVFMAKIDIENFFEDSFDITICYSNKSVPLHLSSSISKDIISLQSALETLNKENKIFDIFLTQNKMYDMQIYAKVFSKKDTTYYFVSVSNSEKMYAFLLDAQTGKMLAKRSVY